MKLFQFAFRFDTIDSLVRDGLISMYVEKHAADYIKNMADEAIYEQSPYSQYNRSTELRSAKQQTQARCHNFLPFTFKMPHYCDYCRNFLWGIVQQVCILYLCFIFLLFLDNREQVICWFLCIFKFILRFKGVRCADCGFSAHKKCSEKTRHDCQPDSKYVKRMFAVDLTTLCMAHSVWVPPVLTQCIDEVERRGLLMEGIYRVSGSHEQMDRLRRQFDIAANVDLSQVNFCYCW